MLETMYYRNPVTGNRDCDCPNKNDLPQLLLKCNPLCENCQAFAPAYMLCVIVKPKVPQWRKAIGSYVFKEICLCIFLVVPSSQQGGNH